MNISFAYTKEQFLAGIKSATRRNWAREYHELWCRQWDKNRVEHVAWDKCSFAKGQRIGRIQLIMRPFYQPLYEMTAQDLIEEGGIAATVEEFCKRVKLPPEHIVSVVKFKKL